MRVLIVEDDPLLAQALFAVLDEAGMVVEVCADGRQAQELGCVERYDAAVLDLGLPGMDGISVLRHWREQGRHFPVLVLTARARWSDKLDAFQVGADDYLTKPFGVMELISRVKALLRRSQSLMEESVLTYGEIRLDADKRTVYAGEELCELTYKEFELLRLLMANAGNVLSRSLIMEKIWGTDFEGESRTLDMHIKTLRQKLGEQGNHIRTVRNVGYQME